MRTWEEALEGRPIPPSFQKRRDDLQRRIDDLDIQIAIVQRKQEAAEAKGEDGTEFSQHLGSLLMQSADAINYLKSVETETMVLFYEREDREKATAFGRGPRVVDASTVGDGPKGLEGKELEEIVYVLRTKQKWTWQQIVDWLVAKGVTKKRGDTNWHTSDVYAIHKKGFSPSRAA